MRDKILHFIEQFTSFGHDVIECFTCGNCYWFAHILQERFGGADYCPIVYDVVENHFATQIMGHIYDITGEVTDDYLWQYWDELQEQYDPLVIERIYRDCINF